MRMMVARALLPIPPSDLFAALAYLATTESGELQTTARKSLAEMPSGVVQGIVDSLEHPELLDFALRQFVDDEELAQGLILNRHTPDESIEWAAHRVDSALVELIGTNQARIIRHPALIEAIYFNPKSPMTLVSRVFETGARAGIDLHHIPGYQEIYESIFGKEAAAKLDAATDNLRGEELDEETLKKLASELPDEIVEHDQSSMSDEELVEAMKLLTEEDDDDDEEEENPLQSRSEAADKQKEKEKEEKKKPMHALIEEMSIPMKIRTALVGNKAARAILIKDSKLVVALAVLKSPQIRENEIKSFCKNKALSDRIISVIARNREWSKSPTIQLLLIKHPKTPAGFTNRWIRVLSMKELKDISRSREVSGHVQRLAKNIIRQRQGGGKR
jgi:hypothetical protein